MFSSNAYQTKRNIFFNEDNQMMICVRKCIYKSYALHQRHSMGLTKYMATTLYVLFLPILYMVVDFYHLLFLRLLFFHDTTAGTFSIDLIFPSYSICPDYIARMFLYLCVLICHYACYFILCIWICIHMFYCNFVLLSHQWLNKDVQSGNQLILDPR